MRSPVILMIQIARRTESLQDARSMKNAMLVILFCLPFPGYTTMLGPVIAPDEAAAD
jgi:hypothetical protein